MLVAFGIHAPLADIFVVVFVKISHYCVTSVQFLPYFCHFIAKIQFKNYSFHFSANVVVENVSSCKVR